MQTVWLNSKTTVPRFAEDAVKRERLVDYLRRSGAKKLTIVRAPTGYGKTTLLSQYVSQFDEPVGWFSIDASDNDPIRFWGCMIQTVSNLSQYVMDEKLAPLFNLLPQSGLLVESFLNELGSIQKKIHIVMDDYHLIENDLIHEMMTRFIEYLPNNVHVYVTSRTDLPLPIAKWRVKSWLIEIDREQLRFTYEEIEHYYEKKGWANKNIQSLQQVLDWTEGWAAGIQLASLSKDTSARDDRTVNLFEDTQPFITEFLLNEILATLPLSTQDFLIHTSVFNELEPEICNELTKRTDSYELLVTLEKKGLFTVRMHSSSPVFRYHHLFKDALQKELENRYANERSSTIFLEAATLLREKGDVHAAIELALSKKFYDIAEMWIAAHIVEVFASGQISTFLRWVRTLLKNNYVVHPETVNIYAFTLALSHEIEEAKQSVLDLEHRHTIDQWMDKEEYKLVVYGVRTVKAYLLIASGESIEQATTIMLEQVEAGGISTKWDGLPIQYNRFEPTILRTSIGARGKLWPDEKLLTFAKLFRDSDYKEQTMTGFSYGLRAESLFERNCIDEALVELKEGLQYGHRFQDPGLFVPMYLLKGRIYAAKKQFVTAHAVLENAVDTVEEWYWISAFQAIRAKLYLMEDNLLQAESELYKATGLNNVKVDSEQAIWLLTHARILLAKKQAKEALKVILQVKEKAIREKQISTMVEASVLEAVCQIDLFEEQAALVALHEALEYGEPYQYIRTFLDERRSIPLLKMYLKIRRSGINNWDSVSVDYVEQLVMAEFNDDTQNPIMEKLTPRERDVLTLLVGGATNSAIARQLMLTEGTVRIYLSNIYSKLEVKSRTQAVLRVKEWKD